MSGDGPFAESIHQMFDLHCRKLGSRSTSSCRRMHSAGPPGPQRSLFD
jgi:hypothetical protein